MYLHLSLHLDIPLDITQKYTHTNKKLVAKAANTDKGYTEIQTGQKQVAKVMKVADTDIGYTEMQTSLN